MFYQSQEVFDLIDKAVGHLSQQRDTFRTEKENLFSGIDGEPYENGHAHGLIDGLNIAIDSMLGLRVQIYKEANAAALAEEALNG